MKIYKLILILLCLLSIFNNIIITIKTDGFYFIPNNYTEIYLYANYLIGFLSTFIFLPYFIINTLQTNIYRTLLIILDVYFIILGIAMYNYFGWDYLFEADRFDSFYAYLLGHVNFISPYIFLTYLILNNPQKKSDP